MFTTNNTFNRSLNKHVKDTTLKASLNIWNNKEMSYY